MSKQQPIFVPSHSASPITSSESDPLSSPITSQESSSPEIPEWPVYPDWPNPEALPFQDKLDLWAASTNPRPTSEEVQVFIRECWTIVPTFVN